MSFILKGIDKFDLDEINDHFSPFTKGENKLPDCTIRFFDMPKDLLNGRVPFKRAGGHSFYIFEEGVMVANATSFALLRENFCEMDVYIPKKGKYPNRQLAFLMLQAYRYALCYFGHFQMHATVVTINGEAVAFCGLSGAGKSTQAHLWEKHLGAQALNLDQPVILFENDKVLASGSPWSGKEDCYKTDVAPLKAIFFIEQAKENCVNKISKAEGFSLLYLNNFLVPISEEIEEKHKKAVEKVVLNVPIYRLRCDISKEAVMTAYNAVFDIDK
jgi:hypothetical protein